MTSQIGKTVCAFLIATMAPAQPPPRWMPADKADAVVVGEVQSGRQIGTSVTFNLAVERTLKGSPSRGDLLSVTGVCAPPGNADLTGNYGMFFLAKDTLGWTQQPLFGAGFGSTYYKLSKSVSAANIPTRSPALTTYDQIALELAARLQAYTGGQQLFQLETALWRFPDSAVVQDAFATLRKSPNPEVRFFALARALKGLDSSALLEVAAHVDEIPRLTGRFFVIQGIYYQFQAGPAAAQPLGLIARSSDVYIQRAAASSLMEIHSRETLPYLAELLESNDPTNRQVAMIGFARFVDNVPIATPFNVPNGKANQPQGPAPFRTAETDRYSVGGTRRPSQDPESDYVAFWKSWWATMKDKLTP